MDVKNALLNGDLEEEVYMDFFFSFTKRFWSKFCKLKRSLYGLKQFFRAWFDKFTQSVKKQGYIEGQTDHVLFMKFSLEGKITMLIAHVDDIILIENDLLETKMLKMILDFEFEIKDLGVIEVLSWNGRCTFQERHRRFTKKVHSWSKKKKKYEWL